MCSSENISLTIVLTNKFNKVECWAFLHQSCCWHTSLPFIFGLPTKCQINLHLHTRYMYVWMHKNKFTSIFDFLRTHNNVFRQPTDTGPYITDISYPHNWICPSIMCAWLKINASSPQSMQRPPSSFLPTFYFHCSLSSYVVVEIESDL